MKIFAFGSSIVSSYWNGAATYYRGCYKYLARLGYDVTFAEPDAYGRQQHRDSDDFSYVRSIVYQPREADGGRDLDRMLQLAAEADVVVKHSGIGCDDAELERRVPAECSATSMTFIWDVDAPATVYRMRADAGDALALACRGYDAILTYGGGPKARDGYREFGARAYYSMYNGLDPETHFPVAPDPELVCDVAFLGNRLPDREARVEELFLRAAALAPDQRFILGGEGWGGKPMPANVRWIGHVPTADHNRVNCSAGMVMNINRASMADFGFSPPTRVFEVAGAGTCLLCDDWPGISDCFEPGSEILVVKSAEDVAAALHAHDEAGRRRIGAAFHARGLRDHTYAQRAAQADYAFRECRARRRGEVGPQTESLAMMADWAHVPGWREAAARGGEPVHTADVETASA
ncbi:MAG TPA: glycosyltransferase [Acidobacteriaceae bacterium]|nr:glycosyltransferase [Acidobacteriaceae bacterium]